jgi:glycosyltransferase involved in cell wall biosynthesis
MSGRGSPKVSIGLPVYNGEDFLREAIDSLLSQTAQDWELIISDNASTDGTETICRAYAARENRIRYVRQKKNIGCDRNFDLVFSLSSGEYFKWAAHDDLHLPNFLARCIEVLEEEPSLILSYTQAITIDAKGRRSGRGWGAGPDLGSAKPHQRFRGALTQWNFPLPLFGVIRAGILRKTRLHATYYPGSDRQLLAELSLHGRFVEIPEPLFLEREHPNAGRRLWDKPQRALNWYDPSKVGKIVSPRWSLFTGYLAAIYRTPLPWYERFRCYVEVVGWIKRQPQSWANQLRRARGDLEPVIPADDSFILVDDTIFGTESFAGRRTLPFLERDGQYWGPPPDDETAIRELERMRGSGAHFIVFGWPSFWWLDHYGGLRRYLSSNFPCLLENSRLVVFDLR